MHRLQGYESRYAIRTSIIVTSLCIPGWIHHSRDWFNNYNLWTAPFIAVVIMHPRVGGNLHDLFVRTACAILGVVWAGISFRAHYGNPYVLCVMCAVFSKYITANILIPFFFLTIVFSDSGFYRYVISLHPRSGSLACISFTITSLTILSKYMKTTVQEKTL